MGKKKPTPPVKPGKDSPPVKPGKDSPPVKPGKDSPPVKPSKDSPPVKPSKDSLPDEIVLTGKDKERYVGLLEELEAVCRHYAEVDGEKKIEMARFKEELDAISKRKEGILTDIDNLKKPLPLFDGPEPSKKICKWVNCSKPQHAGSDYCEKHDKESALLRKKTNAKKKATTKKK